jgi:hypothetical protein
MKTMSSMILLGLKDVLKPKIMAVLLLPFFGSALIWSLITYFSWDWITGLGLEIYNFSIIQRFVEIISPYFQFTSNPLVFVTTAVFLILIIFPAAMITALFITSVVLVPILVTELRKSDFPTMVKKSTNMFTGTTISIGYSIKYFASWIGSLPFWILIPGGALIIPYLLISWFNSRLLTWEILAEIATPEDIKPFAEAHSRPLFILGLITSALYYVPLLNFIAPVIVSSIFTRYCLSHYSKFTKVAAP